MQLMPICCAQFMGDIVQPASKDAGGLVHGTVTDLKEQVGMPFCLVTCSSGLELQHCCGSPFCAVSGDCGGKVFPSCVLRGLTAEGFERHGHNSDAAPFEEWKAASLSKTCYLGLQGLTPVHGYAGGPASGS